MSRTRAARIASLTRACGTGRTGSTCRLGLKGLSSSCCFLLYERQNRCKQRPRYPRRSTRLNPAEPRAREVRNGSAPACQELSLAAALADSRPGRERSQGLLGLAVAVHDHVWDLLQLRLADPLADSLVALVGLGADACFHKFLRQLVGRAAVVAADRQHPHLHRREPVRERSGVVLDEDPDESLERPVKRA